jgi:hypothetical protein
MVRVSTAATRAAATAGLAIALYLAITQPLAAGEARLWYDLVRPSLRDAWQMPDAWSGLLYSIATERFIGIMRLSELALRMPALIAGSALAWLVWRSREPVFLLVYIVGIAAGWFSTAAGHGVALTLWCYALAYPRRAGILFGLAVAFSPPFALLGVVWWRLADIERVLIPAAALLLVVLILPFSHAGPVDFSDRRSDFHRESNRRNAARGGAFQPSADQPK